MEKGRIDMEG